MVGIRRLVPAPLRSLRWRIPWLLRSEAFQKQPIRSMLRAGKFTLLELLFENFEFRCPNNMIFCTPRGNLSSFIMYIEGARDPHIWRFISRFVSEGDVFVDVGANVGTYALPAARLVGQNGRVIAFEAHPGTASFLRKSATANQCENLIIRDQAISDQSGQVRIVYNAGNPGETRIGTPSDASAILVEATTLDAALCDLDVSKIRYIKIDVEGFEIPVLRGALQILTRAKHLAIQTEIDQKHLGASERALEEFFSLLSPLGLMPFRIDQRGELTPAGRSIWGDIIWTRPPD